MFLNKFLENKSIVIYGTGNTGKEFYDKYKDKLNIVGCTSSEKNIDSIENLTPLLYDEMDKEKVLLIICSIYYEEIRKNLILSGWSQNINFIRWDIFDKLYRAEENEKQIIVAVGQCEVQEMCEVLQRIKAFMQKYEVIYFDERRVCIQGDKFDLIENYDCCFVLEKAHYFIRPSVMTPKSVCGFDYLQRKIQKNCNVIKISLFIFDSYWPQDIGKERQIHKYYLIKPNTKLSAFVENDKIITNMLDEGQSNDQIKKKIMKDDFFKKEEVIDNHKTSLKRIRLSDKLSDIKVYDYVNQNYNHKKLFCDRGHFNENMLREYVKKILSYLGENECIKELNSLNICDIFEEINELPIYPSTYKILGLEWMDSDSLYTMNINNKIKKVTFEEYIDAMLEYYSLARKIIKLCYY